MVDIGKEELERQEAEKQGLESQELETQEVESEVLESQELETQEAESEVLENQELETQEVESEVLESQELENQEVEIQNFEIQEVQSQEVQKQVQVEQQSNTVKENKKYDVFDLIKLTGKLIIKNKKKFGIYFLQLALVFVVYFGLVMGTGLMLDTNIMQSPSTSNGMMTLYDSLIIVFFALMMIMSMFALSFFMWVTIRTVFGIDTGIESIELKKVNTPRGSSFFKMLAVQILIIVVFMLIVGLLSLLMFVGEEAGMVLFLWLFPQIMIAGVLVSYYMMFATFGVLCKNETISQSLTNARINLFYSKNGVIVKMLCGNILIKITALFLMFVLMMVSGVLMIIPEIMGLSFVTYIVSLMYGIVYFVLYALIFLFTSMYQYLVYMLNKVRDDKVEDLK